MIDPAAVTAVVVTRGDVPLNWLLRSLWPVGFGEVIVWDNGAGVIIDGLLRDIHERSPIVRRDCPDVGAYGRYEALTWVKHGNEVVYVQDDDCIVGAANVARLLAAYEPGVLTALMPASRDDYDDTVLIGWGSVFDRTLPIHAFARWCSAGHDVESEEFRNVGADFIFPILTPHKRVDGEHEDLPWANAENRTWRRPGYHAVKARYLAQARAIRDAT